MIHLRSISDAPRAKRCDVRASKKTRIETHRRLRDEIAEQRMSAVLVEKHNRHIQDQRLYRQTGETPCMTISGP